ncbi:MAG: 2Fe-2S iron-sulfur cluster binding domain-containing protein [Vicinamibacterales bacterium]
MAAITIGARRLDLRDGETVLDGLLRHGVDAMYSCRKGTCHACLQRCVSGDVPVHAQRGLTDAQRANGDFLACQCRPAGVLAIADPEEEPRVFAKVVANDRLTPTVARLRVAPAQPMAYQAGQFLTVARSEDGVGRQYSLASLPADPYLEMHVRRLERGRLSRWLYDEAAPGTWLELGPASGTCCYTPGQPDRGLVLAGTGTGLAPLLGVARDALSQGHEGPIHLFHGAVDLAGLYLQDDLFAMSCEYPNFLYHPSVLQGPTTFGIPVAPLTSVIAREAPPLAGWQAYVCGNDDIVQQLRLHLARAGVAAGAILSDSFLPAAA